MGLETSDLGHSLGGDLQRPHHCGSHSLALARRALYGRADAAVLLRRNLLMYGLGGVIAPFIGIKLIDWLIALAGWA
jgi:hypothetical protein